MKIGSSTLKFDESKSDREMRETQLQFACNALGCKIENLYNANFKWIIKHNSWFGKEVATLKYLGDEPEISCDKENHYRVVAIVALLEHILGCKWNIEVTVYK